MSEIPAEVETVETVEAEAPKVLPPAAARFAPFFEMLKIVCEEANGARKAYKDATKGHDEAIGNVLATSEDETLAKWREWDKAAGDKIAAMVEKRAEAKGTATKHAQSLVPAIDEKAAETLKTSYLEARKAANLTEKNILALLKNDEATYKAAADFYGIVQIIGLGGQSTTTGSSDIIRKRLASATVDGVDASKDGKVTFTTLATSLKVDGADLRDAAAKAAGVESVRDIPNGTSVSFEVVKGDKKHVVVITTPEETEKASTSEVEASPAAE